MSRRRRSTQVVALADVLLHPSRSEGFGMLVLEAQHIGVPVITTRRGAMKDYTMHGAISASRRVDSRHLHESSPGTMDVGGFLFDFEADSGCSAQARISLSTSK